MCSATCACYISNSNLNSSLTKILDTKGLTNYGDSSDNSKNYQECIDEENATQSNTLLMASLEEMLECGGWCPGDDSYYRFSDINSCVSDCKNYM